MAGDVGEGGADDEFCRVDMGEGGAGAGSAYGEGSSQSSLQLKDGRIRGVAPFHDLILPQSSSTLGRHSPHRGATRCEGQ